jgi:uncharacterized protein
MSLDELHEDALLDLPIFPLPGTVLMPRTFISVHVFEPRYRALLEDCIEGHRAMAIAMLDPDRPADQFERPRIHPIAGIGILRRSAKLPDGRYNIVLEGLARADISDEHGPTKIYRRARARVVEDVLPTDPSHLGAAVASLRALCSRALTQISPTDGEVIEGLNAINDPSRLADMIAAAAIQDADDRQRALAEADVLVRLELVAGALGALLLSHPTSESQPNPGWGITPGKA